MVWMRFVGLEIVEKCEYEFHKKIDVNFKVMEVYWFIQELFSVGLGATGSASGTTKRAGRWPLIITQLIILSQRSICSIFSISKRVISISLNCHKNQIKLCIWKCLRKLQNFRQGKFSAISVLVTSNFVYAAFFIRNFKSKCNLVPNKK